MQRVMQEIMLVLIRIQEAIQKQELMQMLKVIQDANLTLDNLHNKALSSECFLLYEKMKYDIIYLILKVNKYMIKFNKKNKVKKKKNHIWFYTSMFLFILSLITYGLYLCCPSFPIFIVEDIFISNDNKLNLNFFIQ